MVPYDVLIDPMSLPAHPVLGEKQNTMQVIQDEYRRGAKDGEEVGYCPDMDPYHVTIWV